MALPPAGARVADSAACTSQAVRVLARALQLPPSCVSFAGTKDAKALTRQRVCVAGTSAEAVAAAAAQLGAHGLRVGALSYGSSQLALDLP